MKLSALTLVFTLVFFNQAHSSQVCKDVVNETTTKQVMSLKVEGKSSFKEVLEVMREGEYNYSDLPTIGVNLLKFAGGRIKSKVRQRSEEILKDKRDYRLTPQQKPIHPMGIGLAGRVEMNSSRWSGIFAGGNYKVLARASISQGNAQKLTEKGKHQPRSTAMAIKIFNTKNDGEAVKTANAVFQNDLNGKLNEKGEAINFLESAQTNHPDLNFMKIRYFYEALTLIGIATATLKNKLEQTGESVPVNPQIRPVHSLAELGVKNPVDVKVPVWVQIVPRVKDGTVITSDFRKEIAETMARDGEVIYEINAADTVNSKGEKNWEPVGRMIFNEAILSKAVDHNLLFAHDTYNSPYTNKRFVIPKAEKQHDQVPQDIQ